MITNFEDITTERSNQFLLIMSAKQKAMELVGKFADIKLYGGLEVVAKNCALIVVEEVLNNLFQHHEIDYWKEVKKEIEAL